MAHSVARPAPSAQPSPIYVFLILCLAAAETFSSLSAAWPDAPRLSWRPALLSLPSEPPEVCVIATNAGSGLARLRRCFARAGFWVASPRCAPSVLVLRGPSVSLLSGAAS
jgi:hypothetical protein